MWALLTVPNLYKRFSYVLDHLLKFFVYFNGIELDTGRGRNKGQKQRGKNRTSAGLFPKCPQMPEVEQAKPRNTALSVGLLCECWGPEAMTLTTAPKEALRWRLCQNWRWGSDPGWCYMDAGFQISFWSPVQAPSPGDSCLWLWRVELSLCIKQI